MKSQPGNFTPDVFTKKEIKSKAKRDSDDEKFKKWVEELLPTELLRCRSDWDNDHKTVGEEERAFIQQKIKGLKVKQHTKKRLVYVLNHSAGWTYVELWWMMVLCNKPIPRVPYDTPKAGQGKEKDKPKGISALNREFVKFKKRLGEWIEENLDPKLNNKDNMWLFFRYAKQVTQADGNMPNTDKKRLEYVLDLCIGRTYSEIIWITIESFGVMVDSRGQYDKKRKTDESNSDD